MIQRLIILHSSDIHGDVDGLARIATLVAQTKEENPDIPVVYLDAGDSQDTNSPLSIRTDGAAMYHLLRVAGCQASVVSNKCIRRYGMGIIEKYAEAAGFPILVTNLYMPDGLRIPGTAATHVLDLGVMKLGIVGTTADSPTYVNYYNLVKKNPIKRLRKHVDKLKAEKEADAVIILSHLGLMDDCDVAEAFTGEVPLILGGHSHSLRNQGMWVSDVAISHVGAYARYLGRIDLTWDGEDLQVESMRLLRVSDAIPRHPGIVVEINRLSYPWLHND